MRVSGFGYGDESLENDISQVDAKINIAVDKEKHLNKG